MSNNPPIEIIKQRQLGERLLICNPPWMNEILEETFHPSYGSISGIYENNGETEVYEITRDDKRRYTGYRKDNSLFAGMVSDEDIAIFLSEEESVEKITEEINRRKEIVNRLQHEINLYENTAKEIKRNFKETQIAAVKHMGECGECVWNINTEGLLRIYPKNRSCGELEEPSKFSFCAPWKKHASEIRQVIIEDGVSIKRDATGLFSGLVNCVEMDLSRLNTSDTRCMNEMFYSCNNLEKINISNFDTSKVINMYRMFADCHKLKEINLTGFNTINVVTMNSMFENCRALKKIDISGLNINRLQVVVNMFNGCSSLSDVIIGDLDLSNVEHKGGIFSGCEKLKAKPEIWLTLFEKRKKEEKKEEPSIIDEGKKKKVFRRKHKT